MMKRILRRLPRIAAEWGVLFGMAGWVHSVEGFWPTFGIMYLMCVLTSFWVGLLVAKSLKKQGRRPLGLL